MDRIILFYLFFELGYDFVSFAAVMVLEPDLPTPPPPPHIHTSS